MKGGALPDQSLFLLGPRGQMKGLVLGHLGDEGAILEALGEVLVHSISS